MTRPVGRASKIFVALVVASVVGLAIFICMPGVKGARWVGTAQLDVTFLVVDAATQQPVPDASVDSYLADFQDPPHELLTKDKSGRAVRRWPHHLIHGFRSDDRDDVHVPLPSLLYSASAPGYRPTAERLLTDEVLQAPVAYKVGQARATVMIPLTREPSP